MYGNYHYRDVTKCGHWTTSSAKSGYACSNMLDSGIDTFWQSDAVPPHWITAQFSKRTFLSKLEIFFSIDEDESYSPNDLVIKIGDDPAHLTEFKQISSENFGGSGFWFATELGVSTTFIRVEIVRNRNDGKDVRVRGIRLFGSPYSPSLDSTVSFISPEITKYMSIR